MNCLKTAIFLIVIGLIYTIESKTVSWGYKGLNDPLLIKKLILKPASCDNNFGCSYEFKFPTDKNKNDKLITKIIATDSYDDENTIFNILDGGLAEKNVTILVRSTNKKGVYVTFEVYGTELAESRSFI